MKLEKKSILAGVFWMMLLSLLLFWLPFFGGLIAGIVGGRRAGGVASALVAVFLPALLFAFLLFFLTSLLTGVPLIGALAGLGGFMLSASHVGPLLVGAVIGGFLATL